MKISTRIATFLFAASLAALAGCASTEKQQSTGEYIDDAVVTTKVKTAMFNEPTLKSREINVETFKGTVQLSGFVTSQDDINKAVLIAGNVKGVVHIKNDIHVK